MGNFFSLCGCIVMPPILYVCVYVLLTSEYHFWVTALRKFRVNKICYKIYSYNAKGGGDDLQRCLLEQIPVILFSVLCLCWFLVAAAEMWLSDLRYRTHEFSKYDSTFTSFFVSWNACQIRWVFRPFYWMCFERENKAWGQLGIILTFTFFYYGGLLGTRGMILSEE